MRIFAYDRFKPGVTMETITPYLREEVANVWRLWKAGIVRENYARADESGVVIVFELDSVDEAERRVEDFPSPRPGTWSGSSSPSWPRCPSRACSIPRRTWPNPTTGPRLPPGSARGLAASPSRA